MNRRTRLINEIADAVFRRLDEVQQTISLKQVNDEIATLQKKLEKYSNLYKAQRGNDPNYKNVQKAMGEIIAYLNSAQNVIKNRSGIFAAWKDYFGAKGKEEYSMSFDDEGSSEYAGEDRKSTIAKALSKGMGGSRN